MMTLLWGGMWSSCTFPSGPDWERKAGLRVVCCRIISTSALAAWVGCSAGALSGSQKESHVLLVAEKGMEIFLFIFVLSLVCISSLLLGALLLFLVLLSAPLGGWRNT